MVMAIGIGASMWAASYSLFNVLSRMTPSRGAHHFDVQAVLGIEASGWAMMMGVAQVIG